MSDRTLASDSAPMTVTEPLAILVAPEPTDKARKRPFVDFRYRAVKRAIDIALASIGLIILSPVLLMAAILIRLDSPGPALFFQERIGLGGKLFKLVKFRGMYVDARTRFPDLYSYRYDKSELDKAYFHLEDDPRVTRFGRVLRKTSIDELPNLWNVLRGDISLVGPRPDIPEMLPYYGAFAEKVLSVKPGLTSLAKVSGRDRLSFARTLELDLEYVRKRSLLLDFAILARTAVVVIKRDGAS